MAEQSVVVRSKVLPRVNYLDYREELRLDFCYSCAYCSMTEFEGSGIGFQIDHYYPRSTHPQLINEYENLMWTCERCNQYKTDFCPDVQDIQVGNIIIRPDRDDPGNHFDLRGYLLMGKTHTGDFNIEWLDLNRRQLIVLRELRERFSDATDYIAFGIQQLISFKIDRVSKDKRVIFQKIRKRVLEKKGQLEKSINSVLREFARSPLLDDDPGKKEYIKKRKEFLKQSKAITP